MLRDTPKFWIAVLGIFGCTLTFGPLILGYQARRDAYYEQHRKTGMRTVMANAKSLIAAIRAYERRHGKPPEALTNLPGSFPGPGPMARDGWEYSSYSKGWSLAVKVSEDYSTHQSFFDSDRFVYYSDGQHPKDPDNGSLERVGEWGYYAH